MLKKRKSILVLMVVLIMFNLQLFSQAATSHSHSGAEAILRQTVAINLGSPKAYVYNAQTQIDAKNPLITPIIKDGRTLVPVRFIAENFGSRVVWEEETSTIMIYIVSPYHGYTTGVVELQLGSNKMVVQRDGETKEITLDVPAEAINGRT